jgi:hypothetical protein
MHNANLLSVNTFIMQTQKYLYKASVGTSVFLGVASTILFIAAARGAMNNDRGLIINHILKFSTTGATRLYWALALLFAASLAWLLWTVLIGAYKDQYIFLSDKAITVPVVLGTGDPVVVQFDRIKDISLRTQGRTKYRLLRIEHVHGRVEILESVLNSAPLFNRLKAALIERMDAARKVAATAVR